MKIVFACGGTGGHINPALAVAGFIKEQHPDASISFIGNASGMEAGLVPKAGFDFYPIRVKGFQRSLSPKSLVHNMDAACKAVSASKEAGRLLRRLAPDLVVGTGGYVSGPVLRKAHKMGIKTAAHEQNAFPGVANKMLARYVDAVMLAMPQARQYLPAEREYVVTGNPVREEIIRTTREEARNRLGLDNRPMILSFGGSLGAKRMNETIADLIASHAASGRVYHFHATGQYGIEWMPALLGKKGVKLKDYPQIRLSEYIHDMDLCMAAADLVICRAGAITISEIEAKGKASILIPSPNVAENHQFHNAMTLKNRGAGVVIEEKDLTSELLIQEVSRLIDTPQSLYQMGQAAKSGAILDANERIYGVLMDLLS